MNMASLRSCTSLLMIMNFLLFSISLTSTSAANSAPELVESTAPVEKTTHLHFYFHQHIEKNLTKSTGVIIVNTDKNFGFGSTVVIDDPMTQGPERDSKVIGRIQGIYSEASLSDPELMMMVTFVFMDGEFNGSSLIMVGRNAIMQNVREIPIVGGSGVFRFGRGYAVAKTLTNDLVNNVAAVEYNVFVKHY